MVTVSSCLVHVIMNFDRNLLYVQRGNSFRDFSCFFPKLDGLSLDMATMSGAAGLINKRQLKSSDLIIISNLIILCLLNFELKPYHSSWQIAHGVQKVKEGSGMTVIDKGYFIVKIVFYELHEFTTINQINTNVRSPCISPC